MLLIGMLCALSVLLTLHGAVVLSIVIRRLNSAIELCCSSHVQQVILI